MQAYESVEGNETDGETESQKNRFDGDDKFDTIPRLHARSSEMSLRHSNYYQM